MPTILRTSNRFRSTLQIMFRGARLLPFSIRRFSHQHPHPQTGNIIGNPQDFFRYTSGRWIWNEKQQLRERYREFDILELQKIAIESTSSGSCLSMEKLGEGSYNKSFKLTMGNGEAIVARIPNPNAGPASLTTASEVATMDFVSNFCYGSV